MTAEESFEAWWSERKANTSTVDMIRLLGPRNGFLAGYAAAKLQEIATFNAALEEGYNGKPGIYPDWVNHASKDREHREKEIPWLPDLLAALEWQGGTIHQALNAVHRLVAEAKRKEK